MMTITQVYCYQEFYCSVNITISSGSIILKSELIQITKECSGNGSEGTKQKQKPQK